MLQRIHENIKIDAFNLQSIFTVDINKHSAVLPFLSGCLRRKKYQ